MKTLVFDFGNVVAFFDHRRAVAKLLPFTSLSATDLFAAIYGGRPEIDYECGRLTTEEFFRTVQPASKLTCSLEEFAEAFADIFTPNPLVRDLIPLLKQRHRLLLASNTNAAHFAKFSEQFADVLRHFDALCLSFEIGHRKPSADYFAACQREAHAEPQECLFVDDLLENVEAARKQGWHGLPYGPGVDLGGQLRGMGIQFDDPVR